MMHFGFLKILQKHSTKIFCCRRGPKLANFYHCSLWTELKTKLQKHKISEVKKCSWLSVRTLFAWTTTFGISIIIFMYVYIIGIVFCDTIIIICSINLVTYFLIFVTQIIRKYSKTKIITKMLKAIVYAKRVRILYESTTRWHQCLNLYKESWISGQIFFFY